MPRLVGDYCVHGAPEGHRCDAKIIGIGEAPGQREDQFGEPFVGRSGAQLESWWEPLGIRRSHVYLTNVYPYRPPANKIAAIPRDQLEFWIARLHERIAALADPVVLVPMGNVALRALFGEIGMAISDYRGSILSYTDARGRVLKVIPTFHPAATFRQPILAKFCIADWTRIASDQHFKELRLPQATIVVEPSDDEFGSFMAAMDAQKVLPYPALATDIETDKRTNELLCVGFSYDPTKAMVLPLTRRALFSQETRDRMVSYARTILNDPIPKVLQNGQFDQYHLLRNDLPMRNFQWDLMEMDHALDPNDGGDTQAGSEGASDAETIRISMRSLAVFASLYTRWPYYKKCGRKSLSEFNWGGLCNYNGTDGCVTQEVFRVMLGRLLQRGLIGKEDSYSSLRSSGAIRGSQDASSVTRFWEPSLSD